MRMNSDRDLESGCLVIKATRWTYGAMISFFCSGVTTSNCRPIVLNNSNANRVDVSDPRANASSSAMNRKVFGRGSPGTSPNWYDSAAARTVYASFSFSPPDLPSESE